MPNFVFAPVGFREVGSPGYNKSIVVDAYIRAGNSERFGLFSHGWQFGKRLPVQEWNGFIAVAMKRSNSQAQDK